MRAHWKGVFFHKNILKKKINKDSLRKIWFRNSTIPSSLIGQIVYVHNGKIFKPLVITREKVGFKFGEFSFTRKHTNVNKTVAKKLVQKKSQSNNTKKK